MLRFKLLNWNFGFSLFLSFAETRMNDRKQFRLKIKWFSKDNRSRVDFLLFLLSAYNQQDYSTKD